MNSFFIVVVTFVLYLLAYYTYGRFLARKIFKINPQNRCPSETLRDDVDYVPTNKMVLFGHHFTSIAGTGPIVGPAIAIIWGWVPALIWILLGSIFMGAVHDFGSMVVSMRNDGRSIGELAGNIINRRVRILFMLIIFFTLWIVIAIFGVVIASVFTMFPTSVLPVWLQMPIAILLGFVVYKKGASPLISGLIATVFMYLTIWLGALFPGIGDHLPSVGGWVVILLIYAYIASTLPVTFLLQPRDYINAFQLAIAMVLLLLGIAVSHPPMVAPAVHLHPTGAPPIFPILFITIACGAISGFHSLVSSGTTSKQCDNERNAQGISYGSMLLEGLLAVIVLIACGAGIGLGLDSGGEHFTGIAAFSKQYETWNAAKGLSAKIAAFVTGAANMTTHLGISREVLLTLMGVFVASFAATTLDTATRIQRYIVAEISVHCNVPALSKKHPATFIAVVTALLLAFSANGGKGALALWPLFGAVNQLLAGLSLLVITIWLAKRNAPIIYTTIPMVFMVGITAWAMQINLVRFFAHQQWMLLGIGAFILLLQIWMVIEGVVALIAIKRKNRSH